ncbi:unnamed protein product [Acanthoscelides obtectus]|uniref:Uncharacterized protein n=1 Tax=Acanthoscelides obtectus TaxID=200917 RepID=A0A9P0PD99_ACAOB|nr:unnamed protein product [Acanthoscelides obtectus]CAK1660505.1 hypothetical protein AOBTE_LOCUS22122 [Acanthoscelides obtectus]
MLFNLLHVVEEPDSVIQKLKDEFLDIQNEWDGHSEEVFDNLLDEAALEDGHPDKKKIKRCLQKYSPQIQDIREKMIQHVVEEPESLIQRLEDEFLDIQNEWDGHSEEVFDNLLDEVALEGCHPDKEKIKKCIQKYLPEIRALRKKIIDQIQTIRGDVQQLRECREEKSREKTEKCIHKIFETIKGDIAKLQSDIQESKLIFHKPTPKDKLLNIPHR